MHLTTKQDQGVSTRGRRCFEILTTWTPLFDVSFVARACWWFASDARQDTRWPASSRSDGYRDYDRPIDASKDAKGTHCDMKRGDVLFLHRFTPHRGTLNSSDYVRWSVDIRFQKTGTPTGRHFLARICSKDSKRG